MSLITAQDLAHWLGYESSQRQRVERWLRDHRIPYFQGRDGRPCTTTEAINGKLLGQTIDEVEFK